MNALNIAPNFNSPRPPANSNDRRIYSVLFTASLGYLSVGYHLSVFNSVTMFLYDKTAREYEPIDFQNICYNSFAFGAFLVSLFVAFNKIKFADYKKILILADLLMIGGSLCAFGVVMMDSSFIYFGRFVCAEATALNITSILSFVRETQFYLSQSEFKVETRRIFGDGLFAVGVLLGMLSSKIIPSLSVHTVSTSPDQNMYIAIQIAIVPLAVSLLRIILLRCLGDIRSSQYAQAFTDEGLWEAGDLEDNEGGALYMLKFKETKSLIKLFKYPYRKRLLTCIFLYFFQAAVGYFLFILNPDYLYPQWINYQTTKTTAIEFAGIFLTVHIVLGLILLVKKAPRKLFMYLAVIFGAIQMSLATFYYNNIPPQILLFLYYAVICMGFGVAIEIFAEEVLPAKGLQFLQTIKWLFIGVFGTISRSILTIEDNSKAPPMSKIFWGFLAANVIAGIFIYLSVPETANLNQAEIKAFFAGDAPTRRSNAKGDKSSNEVSKEDDYTED